jgi:hypothetical protein
VLLLPACVFCLPFCIACRIPYYRGLVLSDWIRYAWFCLLVWVCSACLPVRQASMLGIEPACLSWLPCFLCLCMLVTISCMHQSACLCPTCHVSYAAPCLTVGPACLPVTCLPCFLCRALPVFRSCLPAFVSYLCVSFAVPNLTLGPAYFLCDVLADCVSCLLAYLILASPLTYIKVQCTYIPTPFVSWIILK